MQLPHISTNDIIKKSKIPEFFVIPRNRVQRSSTISGGACALPVGETSEDLLIPRLSSDSTKAFNQSSARPFEDKLTAKAFLLISAELGDERNVLEKLKSIQNVKEAHLTYGVYDIIAMVEAETQDKLKETITYQIRALPGIKSTITMVVAEH